MILSCSSSSSVSIPATIPRCRVWLVVSLIIVVLSSSSWILGTVAFSSGSSSSSSSSNSNNNRNRNRRKAQSGSSWPTSRSTSRSRSSATIIRIRTELSMAPTYSSNKGNTENDTDEEQKKKDTPTMLGLLDNFLNDDDDDDDDDDNFDETEDDETNDETNAETEDDGTTISTTKSDTNTSEKTMKTKQLVPKLPYYFRPEAIALKPKIAIKKPSPYFGMDTKLLEPALLEIMEEFESDVVGQDLIEEMTYVDLQSSIVEPPVMFAGEEANNAATNSNSNTNTNNIDSFDFDRWELHRSPNRYFRLLVGLFGGVTTRRILPTVVFLIVWSAGVDYYNTVEDRYYLPEIELPLTPFELAGPVLGLLLVFRSNTAFERFNVGSDATWEITSRFRSVIRQLLSFTSTVGSSTTPDDDDTTTPTGRQHPQRAHYSPEERIAAYELVDACFILHGWILCDYLRRSSTSSSTAATSSSNRSSSQNKQTKILQKSLALPTDVEQQLWMDATTSAATPQQPSASSSSVSSSSSSSPSALRFLLRNQQRYQYQSPSALMNTITLGIMTRIPSLDPQEATMLEEQFTQISSSLGTCEKLIRTPIPLGYTRYSVRFVMIWLTLLPFSLVRTFAEFGTDTWWEGRFQPVLVITMAFLSVIFLSIEDISVQIEEPFCILPLELHQKWLKRDIVQMKRTSRLVDALVLHNNGNHNNNKEQAATKKKRTTKNKKVNNKNAMANTKMKNKTNKKNHTKNNRTTR